jgi:hypothetical protein
VTAPQVPVPLTGGAEVRQDAQGNPVVVLRLVCGIIATEFMIAPGSAAQVGEGIAASMREAGERAKAMTPGLTVPPQGLLIPKMNGGRPQ